MKNKSVLITGSTDGIGRQTALDLARMGATILLHGKNHGKAQAVLREIKHTTNNEKVTIFTADLSSQSLIRSMAEEIHNQYDHISVMINNAGVFLTSRKTTVDGLEMTFAVNHLAPFLLTLLLLDLIKKGAPSRIINVSSMTHSSTIDFNNLQGERCYNGYDSYSRSKLCNILFTYELAERLEGKGVTVNCLHPGVINTKLLRAGWGGGDPVTEGSKTLVYLASAPELVTVSRKYFVNKAQETSSSISYNRNVRKRLWKISEKLTKFV